MINWIIGGLIIGAALFIIARSVLRLRKGETTCSGCHGGEKGCCSK